LEACDRACFTTHTFYCNFLIFISGCSCMRWSLVASFSKTNLQKIEENNKRRFDSVSPACLCWVGFDIWDFLLLGSWGYFDLARDTRWNGVVAFVFSFFFYQVGFYHAMEEIRKKERNGNGIGKLACLNHLYTLLALIFFNIFLSFEIFSPSPLLIREMGHGLGEEYFPPTLSSYYTFVRWLYTLLSPLYLFSFSVYIYIRFYKPALGSSSLTI
jgi:hypothetical protein